MSVLLRRFVGIVLGIALVASSSAIAQDDGVENEQFDLRKRLLERLPASQERLRDNDMLRQLLKMGPELLKNPQAAQEFLKNHPQFQDPETLKKLAQLALGEAKDKGAGNVPQVQSLQKALDKLKSDSKGEDGLQAQMKQRNPPNIDAPPTPEQQRDAITNNPRTREVLRWAERTFGPLSENPAIRDALTDFASGDFGEWTTEFGDVFSDLQQYEGEFREAVDWISQRVGSASNWDLPNVDLGGGSGFGGGGYSGGGGFSGSGSTQELSWAPVIVLGLLGAAGLIYWWLHGMERTTTIAEPSIEERLGPWPIDPRSIQTPEQFVRAFEYLSLSECGIETKTWNHIEIAEELQSRHRTEQDRVARLAGLYEHARYAPATMPLTPGQIDAGRRDLCHLIGVPVS